MTEQEWLSCSDDPQAMLRSLRDKASARKLRLFAVACCRRVWDAFSDERSREAIRVAEGFADGTATSQQLQAAYAAAPNDLAYGAAYCAHTDPFTAAWDGSDHIRLVVHIDDDRDEEWCAQAALLRCIVGNPHRFATLGPALRTATVQSLAQAIYDERAFDRLPILADALEDAGCANQDVLHHCRNGGEHFRGCWVVDVVLGRQ